MEVYEECNPGINCDKPDNGAECCEGKVKCKKPRRLRDIKTECIFVEKVFDARLFRKESDFDVVDLIVDISPDLDTVETVNVDCELVSFSTSITQLFVDDEEVTPLQTIPGPGGDQTIIPQNMVDTEECGKKGKGTKVSIRQRVTADFTVDLTVTGTGTKSGITLDYSGTATIMDSFTFLVKIDNFCFPPQSLFPVSVFDACIANCFFDLSSFTFDAGNDQLTINGTLVFCMCCEKKLKVPVQICVLTTGKCKIKKQDGSFCSGNDFPSLCAKDMNDDDNDDDCDCGCNKYKDCYDFFDELDD